MAINYRRPGVYLTESVLSGSTDIGTASSVAAFVGAASKGPTSTPKRIDSWTDYSSNFGGFTPANGTTVSYLPYAVFNFFQNGGASCYVMRSVDPDAAGTKASYNITDGAASNPDNVLKIEARSEGVWGNDLKVATVAQTESGYPDVFTIIITDENDSELERFTDLSIDGSIPGTKGPASAINDSVYGSKYVTCTVLKTDEDPDMLGLDGAEALISGTDAGAPDANDLTADAKIAVEQIEGPVLLNVAGHMDTQATPAFVSGTVVPSTAFPDRGDVFVIDDNYRKMNLSADTDVSGYVNNVVGSLGSSISGSSYGASYTPWITVPDPAAPGSTIDIPPGGAVAGIYARTDATRGVFRAPAGVLATLSNCLDTDVKFSSSQQGELNSKNINVIRPVAGSGIAVMGGRTRKPYGADRYINARRTLIYIKESLRASTQFAVFENNDQRLWTRLTSTADRILRPIWSEGGLRGSSAAEAYYIICDDTINTAPVISSGEVRMEIGVALEYPAEFIVIQLSQYEGGTDLTVS